MKKQCQDPHRPTPSMTALVVLLLTGLLFAPLQDAAAAKRKDAEYITIQELYAQTRNGWHATYTPPKGAIRGKAPEGYSIAVDLPILMPDIPKIPIIELQINHDILKDDPYLVDRRQPGQVREDGSVYAVTFQDDDYPHFDINSFPASENG